MANVVKASKKLREWAGFMGYDVKKIKDCLKADTFSIEKLSLKKAESEGLDTNYPYRVYNPFSHDISA